MYVAQSNAYRSKNVASYLTSVKIAQVAEVLEWKSEIVEWKSKAVEWILYKMEIVGRRSEARFQSSLGLGSYLGLLHLN